MPERRAQLDNWLQQHLDGSRYSIAPASEDASFRRYFRVSGDDWSRIVMDAPPQHEDCQPFIDIDHRLRAAGVNAPEITAADPDLGFILMSDLGSQTYLDVLDESLAEPLYADAINTLLQMQERTRTDGLPEYDAQLLRAEMQLFPDWLLARHLDLTLDGAQQKMLQTVFAVLADSALAQPRTFVHRDYHSRNLMHSDNNPGVLDFQDAVHGPITYDLVSLLRDCYITWPQTRIDQWLEHYRTAAVARGLLSTEDLARFGRWFDLMGIQRHLKAAGIFARLLHRDGKPGYIGDIPRTLQYVANVASLYDELRPFGAFVAAQVLPALAARAAQA